jgi:hypothetical protein
MKQLVKKNATKADCRNLTAAALAMLLIYVTDIINDVFINIRNFK